jgi:putative ABC transport system permease protein
VNFITLDYSDILLASLTIAVNAGLSITMRLHLGQRLVIAALRMVAQLILVGLVLKALFAAASPLLTGFALMVMILFAGREAMARQDRKFGGWWSYGLGTGSMMAAGLIVLVFGLTTQISPDPWYDPRYAIPLMGMILGNTMNGVSIGLDRMMSAVVGGKMAIEAQLCLGESSQTALRPVVREALRAAFIPSINAMSAAGIVSLPGMMTGQVLAGADPVEAVKYQIVIMFLIAGGTGIGSFAAVYMARQRLTDSRHRLRLDRLMPAKGL